MEDRNTRFAELVMELFGAKMGADFVRELWTSVSDDVKTELATSVLRAATEKLKTDEYAARQLVQEVLNTDLREMARKLVEDRLGDIEQFVRQAVEARWRGTAEEVVKQALKQIEVTALDKVKQAADEAVWKRSRY